MKGLLQRVSQARVEVEGEIVGSIDQGLLVPLARGELQQFSANQKILARSRQGISADDSVKQVCFDERQTPKLLVPKQPHNLIAIVTGFRFDRPPQHERLVNVG